MSDTLIEHVPVDRGFTETETRIEELIRVFAYIRDRISQDCKQIHAYESCYEVHQSVNNFNDSLMLLLEFGELDAQYSLMSVIDSQTNYPVKLAKITDIWNFVVKYKNSKYVLSYLSSRCKPPSVDSYEPNLRAIIATLPDFLREKYREFIRIVYTTKINPKYYGMLKTINSMKETKKLCGAARHLNSEMQKLQDGVDDFIALHQEDIDAVVCNKTEEFTNAIITIAKYAQLR